MSLLPTEEQRRESEELGRRLGIPEVRPSPQELADRIAQFYSNLRKEYLLKPHGADPSSMPPTSLPMEWSTKYQAFETGPQINYVTDPAYLRDGRPEVYYPMSDENPIKNHKWTMATSPELAASPGAPELALGEYAHVMGPRGAGDAYYNYLVDKFSNYDPNFIRKNVQRAIRNGQYDPTRKDDSPIRWWERSGREGWIRANLFPQYYGLPGSGWPEALRSLPPGQREYLDQIKRYLLQRAIPNRIGSDA